LSCGGDYCLPRRANVQSMTRLWQFNEVPYSGNDAPLMIESACTRAFGGFLLTYMWQESPKREKTRVVPNELYMWSPTTDKGRDSEPDATSQCTIGHMSHLG